MNIENSETGDFGQVKDELLSLIEHQKHQQVKLSDVNFEKFVGEGFYRLGKVYYDKADLVTAEGYFLQALDKTIYPRDVFAQFKCYGFLIRIYSERLMDDEVQKYTKLAEELVEKYSVDCGSLSAQFFYNIGMVYSYKGEFEQALENFTLGYRKAQQENEPNVLAKSLYAMANANFHLDKAEEALGFLEQLKELLHILNKDYLKGSMHMLYGHVYSLKGENKLASDAFDTAIKVLQEKNCWNLFGYILLGKGIVAKNAGEFQQALANFRLGTNCINSNYKRLLSRFHEEIEDLNDSSVDLYLDRHHRVIHEKTLGTIDFKHRFVLLEILFLLAKNPGSSYNKEDLAKSIWKDEYNPLIHDKLIYTSISRLRKLIEPKGENRKYILRGKDGYTFNPRVNARFHKDDDKYSKKILGNIEISAPV